MATIQSREATIRTAVVEIKALTISGKQVTLAVFRQLENEPLVDPRGGELFGLPWGRVNYHVDCEGMSEHLHVVWQKGDELRRARVMKLDRENFSLVGESRGKAVMHLNAAVLQASLDLEPVIGCRGGDRRARDGSLEYGQGAVIQVGGLRLTAQPRIAHGIQEYWRVRSATGRAYFRKQWVEELSADERRLLALESYNATLEMAQHEGLLHTGWRQRSPAENCRYFEAGEAEAKRLEQAWSDAYEGLLTLDQLFIAV